VGQKQPSLYHVDAPLPPIFFPARNSSQRETESRTSEVLSWKFRDCDYLTLYHPRSS
jgi:hypothetical protein